MALTNTLMIHCRKVTELVERRDLKPLTIGERTGLWFHKRICKYCKAYEAQSQAMDGWLEQRMSAPSDTTTLEARILARIKG